MKGKISYTDYALYFSNGRNTKMNRPHWLLFKIFGSESEAKEVAEYLKKRYGWEIKIEKKEMTGILR